MAIPGRRQPFPRRGQQEARGMLQQRGWTWLALHPWSNTWPTAEPRQRAQGGGTQRGKAWLPTRGGPRHTSGLMRLQQQEHGP